MTSGKKSFLSTLPARGATAAPDLVYNCFVGISIHAPREGSDPIVDRIGLPALLISIHAPREGSDCSTLQRTSASWTFLSTLPARGATSGDATKVVPRNISIHAPREGSDTSIRNDVNQIFISIHAPREGSDGWLRPPRI